jgi:hypothetical protein
LVVFAAGNDDRALRDDERTPALVARRCDELLAGLDGDPDAV